VIRALLLADLGVVWVLGVAALACRSLTLYVIGTALAIPLALYARWWLRTWAERNADRESDFQIQSRD
jgi:hypothetical protein